MALSELIGVLPEALLGPILKGFFRVSPIFSAQYPYRDYPFNISLLKGGINGVPEGGIKGPLGPNNNGLKISRGYSFGEGVFFPHFPEGALP